MFSRIWNNSKWVALVGAMMLALAFWLLHDDDLRTVNSGAIVGDKAPCCVVIDAGHGGMDPGKIGINGALEKDVNLKIAGYLKTYLEAADIKVVMTRETEDGLYEEGDDNKKVQDMKRRIEIIEQANPILTVSIHQNSFPEEYVKGAQVFYYTDSVESEKLASLLQKSMVKRLDEGNHREIKPNATYYLLKKTPGTIAIVECGFLSNYEEAEKLCEVSYEQQVAWAIHMGILQYLNE